MIKGQRNTLEGNLIQPATVRVGSCLEEAFSTLNVNGWRNGMEAAGRRRQQGYSHRGGERPEYSENETLLWEQKEREGGGSARQEDPSDTILDLTSEDQIPSCSFCPSVSESYSGPRSPPCESQDPDSWRSGEHLCHCCSFLWEEVFAYLGESEGKHFSLVLLVVPGNSKLLKSQHMSINFEDCSKESRKFPPFGQQARKSSFPPGVHNTGTYPPVRHQDEQTDN